MIRTPGTSEFGVREGARRPHLRQQAPSIPSDLASRPPKPGVQALERGLQSNKDPVPLSLTHSLTLSPYVHGTHHPHRPTALLWIRDLLRFSIPTILTGRPRDSPRFPASPARLPVHLATKPPLPPHPSLRTSSLGAASPPIGGPTAIIGFKIQKDSAELDRETEKSARTHSRAPPQIQT